MTLITISSLLRPNRWSGRDRWSVPQRPTFLSGNDDMLHDVGTGPQTAPGLIKRNL